jgi:Zn2+/Cd2+-exporting ATPase
MVSASQGPVVIALRVHGLDCAEEVAVLKRAVGPTVGGEENLAFDVLRSKMTVLTTARPVSLEELRQAVAGTGMRAEPWQEARAVASFWVRRGRALSVAASGLLLTLGFLAHAALTGGPAAALGGELDPGAHQVPLAARILYLLAMVAGAWFILPKSWFAARSLRPDMNLLMAIAITGAVVIGEWLEGAAVAFLFGLSHVLESWSVARARRAVESLLDLSPSTARIRVDGTEREVPAAEVAPGTLFLVRPGDRIPLDGRVVAGESHLDQAPITGESVPVAKGPGDEVFAGTINGSGALDVRSTRGAGDTTLARIIRLVEEAQARRSPAERWVDRFARVYTPSVLALALLVFLAPPLLNAGSWSEWFYRALVLLVIACPCALVISTPVTVVASLAAAARAGVLIKGGAFVEAPARLRALAFDKTGTLTEGRFGVVELVPLDGHDEAALLARAAALEARSEHPLARAIVEHAERVGVAFAPAEAFRSIEGRGATGRIGGKAYWVGSHRYLEERGQETPAVHARLDAISSAGRTVVVVGNDDHVCGLIGVADAVRSEAAEVVADLSRLGIEHLVMLTGDNLATARAVAAVTGVEEVRAELLPEDKVSAVQELVARYGFVAMVGDGVNDAPALATSSLGIAMGAAGSDAAIETADIALMSDDLRLLPWLVRHSRRTVRTIRWNIAFALGVKALVFALAVAGVASLWLAIAADMGASLLVIANGLRLLRQDRFRSRPAPPPPSHPSSAGPLTPARQAT